MFYLNILEIIGASLSEPHTSEFAGESSVYMYVHTYAWCLWQPSWTLNPAMHSLHGTCTVMHNACTAMCMSSSFGQSGQWILTEKSVGECDRAQRAAETAEQREECLRLQRERTRAHRMYLLAEQRCHTPKLHTRCQQWNWRACQWALQETSARCH